jgi:meiosis arrest female protein 1
MELPNSYIDLKLQAPLFAGEVVELLRGALQFSMSLRKFLLIHPNPNHARLTELLDVISGVVEMDQNNEENRKIFLSRKVALRIFSEQLLQVIKRMTSKSGTMVKVDDVMKQHKDTFGYEMQGASLGYETVIDALKFVPFVELSSFDNESWIVSHLDNEKFRQHAMLACLAITDVGTKVPLAKFHSVFGEKFKFNVSEKALHAMKHAVEIEEIYGDKMISVTQMMKFVIHVVNILEQKNTMNIQELKSVMKLNLTATFNFGHENVSSLIQAFPDVIKFAGDDKNLQLNPECPCK